MKHLKAFEDALNSIHGEGRYRVFVDLHRHKGRFPKATARFEDGEREVTIWCSNDYLGMGQDEDVINSMHEAIDSFGAGSVTSPARLVTMSILSANWQICTARSQRSCSHPATFPMRRHCRPWARFCLT